MDLFSCDIGREYIIDAVNTEDEETDSFLFSLGCYGGEPITVISRRRSGCVIAVKDGRYSIDKALATRITVK
jgi:ferrous iron transport protein A